MALKDAGVAAVSEGRRGAIPEQGDPLGEYSVVRVKVVRV